MCFFLLVLTPLKLFLYIVIRSLLVLIHNILQLLCYVCFYHLGKLFYLYIRVYLNLNYLNFTWIWVRFSLLHSEYICFPGGSDRKESSCNEEDLSLIPVLERFPGEGHGNPFQFSCLENPHGQKRLVGCSRWGHKELDMAEWLSTWIWNELIFLKEMRSGRD